jgi:hypothetical protein
MQFGDTPHRETVKHGRFRAVAATRAAYFPGNRLRRPARMRKLYRLSGATPSPASRARRIA